MKKSELRKRYLEKRKALSHDEVLFLSQKIFKNFVLQFKRAENQKVHVFLSIQKFNEISTDYFIKYFFEQKMRVFVPKISDGKLISVEIFTDTLFETNSWGILEPISNEDSRVLDYDYIITPLLFCDAYGNRVGYGKGFYDQFFSVISKKSKKIGVNFFTPNESIDDISEHDIPLDYLVTPETVLSFGKGTSKSTK